MAGVTPILDREGFRAVLRPRDMALEKRLEVAARLLAA